MRRTVPFERSGLGSILEPASEVPVHDEVDVLVVGGGPAGVGAALSAARAGMRTRLVERYGCLGGIWTAGLLNPYFDGRSKGGIPTEIIDRLHAHGGADATKDWDYVTPLGQLINPEAMKYVLDRMAEEAGVEVLLYTYAVGTILEDEAVRGVIVENKSGRSAILATVVIDCTGDGDVAYHAGCEFEYGRIGDGLVQPMTLQFKVSGFDFTQDVGDHWLYHVLREHNSEEELAAVPFVNPWAVPIPGMPATVAVQWTHLHGADGTDAESLTRAAVEGRRQVHSAMRLLESARDVLGDVRLIETAMQIGVRETRRIRGEYHLELEDLTAGRSFDDGICRVHFGVDIHVPDGGSQRVIKVQPYHVPYRCLVPLGVEQLLVAGRCISGSHEAHASYRVTGNCVAMGEAAGLAAAQAVEHGLTPREVDGVTVRQLMEKNGANL
ncbi:MAG TPA: FAD-dependent oxidoreductase [Nitriliruptorales bacterium]